MVATFHANALNSLQQVYDVAYFKKEYDDRHGVSTTQQIAMLYRAKISFGGEAAAKASGQHANDPDADVMSDGKV